MKTIELTDEELGTLIEALGDWLADSRPDERTWLRRQDRGGFLDIELRELLNRDDDWDSDPVPSVASGTLWADDMIQAGIDAREQVKATSRAATRRQQRLAAQDAVARTLLYEGRQPPRHQAARLSLGHRPRRRAVAVLSARSRRPRGARGAAS